MKNTLGGIIVVVFVGVLFTGLLNVFDNSSTGRQMDEQLAHYPYYMSY